MAIFKCKMCGGDLNVTEGTTVAECEYCETRQTIPSVDNEKKLNLFNRANRLRMNSEFDKAASIYESIVAEFPEEAEAYWGLCLCNYGIEYVDDPLTAKKIPTCHRASFESLGNDENFKSAVRYADGVAQSVYNTEAAEIDRIMQEILSVSKNEKPYDVFICYKETDEKGERTLDSVEAHNIYDALTSRGLKVFFARITLEHKLGREYEPYIFAALNSAKVMLAIGTKPDYFNAVWVKNEWSRFLKLMAKDKSKLLIPCYKNMDPYDLPDEFRNLQAQDLSKLGAIQDIIHGIEKIVGADKAAAPVTAAVSGNVDSLLRRAFMFLEDNDWRSADEYCEKVLDVAPENAEAYLGKLLAEQRVNNKDSLRNVKEPFENSLYYGKIMRFGDDSLKNELVACIEFIKNRNEQQRIDGIYADACNIMNKKTSEKELKRAAVLFGLIPEYKDSAELEQICYDKAEIARKEDIYIRAYNRLPQAKTKEVYLELAGIFETIKDYKDSVSLIEQCHSGVEYLRQCEENARIAAENAEIARKDGVLANAKKLTESEYLHDVTAAIQQLETIRGWKDADECIDAAVTKAEELKKAAELKNEKNKRIGCLVSVLIFIGILVAFGAFCVHMANEAEKEENYNHAVELYNEGNYAEAATAFAELEGYLDSDEKLALIDAKYTSGIEHMDNEDYPAAIIAFLKIPDYKDSNEKIEECKSILTTKLDGKIQQENRFAYFDSSMLVLHPYGLVSFGEADGAHDFDRWSDIIAISATSNYALGLKADGTVVSEGSDSSVWRASDWTDIKAVAAGATHAVGLKSDGTVVATGDNDCGQCNVEDWTDIVAIAAGMYHTVGLKADGTVVATAYIDPTYYSTYDDYLGQCAVSDWTDIVAIAAGDYHTVGLKSDGTVVATGDNEDLQCDVSDWKNIKAIFAGDDCTFGVKSDGTVIPTGYDYYSKFEIVREWNNVISIGVGYNIIGCLTSDEKYFSTSYSSEKGEKIENLDLY